MCVIRQDQEHYLCDAGEGGNWTHYPELVMLASIKAEPDEVRCRR